MARTTLVLITLLALAACAPEPETDIAAPAGATATQAEPNVCAMMTMEQLQTAAGLAQAPGMSSQSGGADACTWTGEDGKSVIVQIFPSATSYDQMRQQLGGTPEDVTAVGDKAFFVNDTLVAQKGSTPVSVQIAGGTGTPETRKGEAIAVAFVILNQL